MSDNYENKFARFINGKGFYAVLALCLAGAGTAAYLAMDFAAEKAVQPPAASSGVTAQSDWNFPLSEEAQGKQSGIRIESSPSSASSSEQPSSQSQPQEKAEQDVPAAAGRLTLELPLSGEVFTPYSNGALVKSETLGDWRTHNGVDIAATEGAAVKAAARGKVTKVKNDSLWGHVVEIAHSNGVTTVYCGLSDKVSVKEGDSVKLGQVIGLVGYIPCESLMPSHLHFECRSGDGYSDPMQLIKN